MSKWRITCVDTVNGEVYSEEQECFGLPTLTDPYCGMNGRNGIVLRVEKILLPSEMNTYT
jgi:hypothetical protein